MGGGVWSTSGAAAVSNSWDRSLSPLSNARVVQQNSTTVPFGGRARERSERSRDPRSRATAADSPPPGLDTASPRGSAGSTTEATGPLADWVLVTPPQHGDVTNDVPVGVPGLSSDFTYVPDADSLRDAEGRVIPVDFNPDAA